MKLRHKSGMYWDTIPNMLKTLEALNGRTTKEAAHILFMSSGNVTKRIRQLNEMAGGETITWSKTGIEGGVWTITELGKQTLRDNAEVMV